MGVVGRLAGLLILVSLVVVGAWFWLGNPAEPANAAGPEVDAGPEDAAPAPSLVEPLTIGTGSATAAAESALVRHAVDDPAADSDGAEPELVEVLFEFIHGGFRHKQVVLPSVELVLTRKLDDKRIVLHGEATSQLRGTVESGLWRVQVTAPEHHFVSAELWLESEAQGSGPPSTSLSLPLWPENLIPVIVRTPNGRPFTELAASIDSPARFFAGVFEARAGYDSRFAPSLDGEGEEPADFYRVKSTWRLELPGGIAGYLRVRGDPPFWVQLSAFGTAFRNQLVGMGAREVRFQYSLEDLRAQLGSMVVTVLDSTSKEPVMGVAGALKFNSTHAEFASESRTGAARRTKAWGTRWTESSDAHGQIRVDHLAPGLHTLHLDYFGEVSSREFLVHSGKQTDLGLFEVEPGPTIVVRVVDEAGAELEAFVETSELYEDERLAALWFEQAERTDANGALRMATPTSRSGLRARSGPTSEDDSGLRFSSRVLLFDPDDSTEEVTLVVTAATRVRFVSGSTAASGVAPDALVAGPDPDTDPPEFVLVALDYPTHLATGWVGAGSTAWLLPGSYELRSSGEEFREGDSTEGRMPFEVGTEPVVVTIE